MTRKLCLLAVLSACAPAPVVTPPPRPAPPTPAVAPPLRLGDRGRFPVGVRTVKLDDVDVEIWYPAGDERGAPPVRYDLRTVMPPVEAAKIPDADNAWLPCECARDLSIARGRFPTVLFFHGAASFRAQSASLVTHWASRGFVVIAPQLVGVDLAAMLGDEASPRFGAAVTLYEALVEPRDDDPFAAFRPVLDTTRIGVTGHSLGSIFVQTIVDRPNIAVRIALAGAGGSDDATLPTLVVLGETDGIARPPETIEPRPHRWTAVIPRAGHLAFTDLCALGADRGGSLAIAKAHGVAIPAMLDQLGTDGCRPTDAPAAETHPAIRAVTTGVLEAVLGGSHGGTLDTVDSDYRIRLTRPTAP